MTQPEIDVPRILSLYNDDKMSCRQIAALLGVPREHVYRIVRDGGTMRRVTISPESRMEFFRLYSLNEESIRAIGARFGLQQRSAEEAIARAIEAGQIQRRPSDKPRCLAESLAYWEPLNADFSAAWLARVPVREMADRFCVTIVAICRHRIKLKLPPRNTGPRLPTAVRAAKQAEAKRRYAAKKRASKTGIERPVRIRAPRKGVTRVLSAGDIDAAVAAFIAQGGVKLCPVAAASPTSASIPAHDAAALRAHHARQNEDGHSWLAQKKTVFKVSQHFIRARNLGVTP